MRDRLIIFFSAEFSISPKDNLLSFHIHIGLLNSDLMILIFFDSITGPGGTSVTSSYVAREVRVVDWFHLVLSDCIARCQPLIIKTLDFTIKSHNSQLTT